MLKNYFKIAGRNLLRHKGYSFINIIGLAVGIACCTLIMLFVQDELSFDENHAQAKNIYRLTIEMDHNGTLNKGGVTSPPIAPKLKEDFPEIKNYVRISNPTRSLIKYGNSRFYEENGIYADSSFFNIFTFPLTAGNARTALSDPNSIVLSQELARKYFGAKDPLGQVIELELGRSRQLKVTGVLAPIPGNTHLRPAYILPFHLATNDTGNWWGYAYYSYLLVNDNFNAQHFEEKLPGFVKKYQPVPAGSSAPPSLHVQPLLDVHLAPEYGSQMVPAGDMKNIYLFSALALFIILLACINFMNLATARSQNRSKEVGVRKVIGASKKQLIGQFLSESILVSVISLALAVGLVKLALPAFNQLAGKVIAFSYLNNFNIIAGLVALALLVGFAAGLYPAFFLSAFKPIQVLKGRMAASVKGALLRKSLVVLQFAISIGLIVSTAVVYNQMQFIQNKRLGFDKEQLLIVQLSGTVNPSQATTIKNEFLQVPGVVKATATNAIPGNRGWWQTSLNATDQTVKPVIGFVFQTDFDYLQTMAIPVAAGRGFGQEFSTDTARAALLNEAAVKAFGWNTPDAVGKKVSLQDGEQPRTIVGVVKDFNFQTLRSKVEPAIFAIATDQFRYLVLRLRPDNVISTIDQLRQKWAAYDSQHPFEYSFVDENLNNQYQSEMRLGKIFTVFAGLAIFIACLGLLGLASFTTEQRTKEIGIRKVLGASVSSITAMLSKDFMKLVLLANVIAWPVAWYGMNQWLQDFEYRMPISWWIFGIAAGLELFIALLTVSFHAIKAAISNPVNALRSE